MKYLLTFFLVFSSFILLGQELIKVSGYVLDDTTEKPIEFANIGFVEKGVGTVTNIDGKFDLVFQNSLLDDSNVLQISSIGYETRKIKASEFIEILNRERYLKLSPITYDLGEVVLRNEVRKKEVLGSASPSSVTMGYWRKKDALGGEIAKRIRIRKKKTKLLDLNFYVLENLADSILVRVDIYDYEKRNPGKNQKVKKQTPYKSNKKSPVKRKSGLYDHTNTTTPKHHPCIGPY